MKLSGSGFSRKIPIVFFLTDGDINFYTKSLDLDQSHMCNQRNSHVNLEHFRCVRF